MKINWLWDTSLKESRVADILKNEKDPRFYIYAEKLFSRVSDPNIAFKYVPKHIFHRYWPVIKERIMKDAWARERAKHWQSIYDKISDLSPERIAIAEQIKGIRVCLGYNQQQMAQKLGVIQQYVSRLETGRENLTVDALKRIADVFDKKLTITLD